jgi:biotin/methionine sulfoxide reductase
MHPEAATSRGIRDGDIVRLFNERGACLAAVRLSAGMRKDVVQLPTGAWFDPVDDGHGRMMCVHGNPNVLTRDVGTSSLAQGCTGQLTVVQVERYEGALPAIRAYEPPQAY